MKSFVFGLLLLLSSKAYCQTTDVLAGFPCVTGNKNAGVFDITLQSVLVRPNDVQQLGLQFKYALLKTGAARTNIYAPALYVNLLPLKFGAVSEVDFNCNPGYYFTSVGTQGFSLNYGLVYKRGIAKKVLLAVQLGYNHFFKDHLRYLSPGAGIRLNF